MALTRSLLRHSLLCLSILAISGLAVFAMDSSGSAASPDKKAARQGFEDRARAHGLTVHHGAAPEQKTGPRGRVTIDVHPDVTLKGFGKRTLTGVIEDEPIAEGGRQKTTISDPVSKTTTVFSYDPATNSITIADDASQVVVVQNPDHSYSVDGVAAANGRAAVALLQGKPAYQSASPHSLMLAYAYAHSPNAAAKGCSEADGGGPLATPPAVCALFEDFCECAACDKTGKRAACASCE